MIPVIGVDAITVPLVSQITTAKAVGTLPHDTFTSYLQIGSFLLRTPGGVLEEKIEPVVIKGSVS